MDWDKLSQWCWLFTSSLKIKTDNSICSAKASLIVLDISFLAQHHHSHLKIDMKVHLKKKIFSTFQCKSDISRRTLYCCLSCWDCWASARSVDRKEEPREPCEAVGRAARDEVEEAAGEVDIRMLETTMWGREAEVTVARIGPALASVTSGWVISHSHTLHVSTRIYQEVTRSASRVASDCQTLRGSLLSQETQRRTGVDDHQETSPTLRWPLLPGENWEVQEGKTAWAGKRRKRGRNSNFWLWRTITLFFINLNTNILTPWKAILESIIPFTYLALVVVCNLQVSTSNALFHPPLISTVF